MPLYLSGRLELVSRCEFTNRDTGEKVVWYKNYFQVGDEISVLNSGKDFTGFKGKFVHAVLRARPIEGGYKLTVQELREEEPDEATIE